MHGRAAGQDHAALGQDEGVARDVVPVRVPLQHPRGRVLLHQRPRGVPVREEGGARPQVGRAPDVPELHVGVGRHELVHQRVRRPDVEVDEVRGRPDDVERLDGRVVVVGLGLDHRRVVERRREQLVLRRQGDDLVIRRRLRRGLQDVALLDEGPEQRAGIAAPAADVGGRGARREGPVRRRRHEGREDRGRLDADSHAPSARRAPFGSAGVGGAARDAWSWSPRDVVRPGGRFEVLRAGSERTGGPAFCCGGQPRCDGSVVAGTGDAPAPLQPLAMEGEEVGNRVSDQQSVVAAWSWFMVMVMVVRVWWND